MKLEITSVFIISCLFQFINGLYLGNDDDERLLEQYWAQTASLLGMADFEILKLYPSNYDPNMNYIDCIDNGTSHLNKYYEEGYVALKNCIVDGHHINGTLLTKHLHASSCEEKILKKARSEISKALTDATSCITSQHTKVE